MSKWRGVSAVSSWCLPTGRRLTKLPSSGSVCCCCITKNQPRRRHSNDDDDFFGGNTRLVYVCTSTDQRATAAAAAADAGSDESAGACRLHTDAPAAATDTDCFPSSGWNRFVQVFRGTGRTARSYSDSATVHMYGELDGPE